MPPNVSPESMQSLSTRAIVVPPLVHCCILWRAVPLSTCGATCPLALCSWLTVCVVELPGRWPGGVQPGSGLGVGEPGPDLLYERSVGSPAAGGIGWSASRPPLPFSPATPRRRLQGHRQVPDRYPEEWGVGVAFLLPYSLFLHWSSGTQVGGHGNSGVSPCIFRHFWVCENSANSLILQGAQYRMADSLK